MKFHTRKFLEAAFFRLEHSFRSTLYRKYIFSMEPSKAK